jgi:serine protease AprX
MTAVNELWDAGLIVVAAAGNNGPKQKTITAPGISRKIITVGSCEEPALSADRTWASSYFPGSHFSDSRFSRSHKTQRSNLYSGRGPTVNCIKKPDITAPGNDIYSCHNQRREYISKSGTSMSTPMVSGALALLLSISPSLSNKEVKLRLLTTARDLHLPWQQQGAGMLDIQKLLGL